MKIVKLCVIDDIHYVVFDEIPEITYEENGSLLIGSYEDCNGRIILSNYLTYSSKDNAFGGNEIKIAMKNGKEKKLRNHWFDHGYYPEHGIFTIIGASTIEDLKKLYIYRRCDINSDIFQNMLKDYYSRDIIYSYNEIEDWIDSEKEQK